MGKDAAPKMVKRRSHKKSTFRAGRTIAEKRERLETANEREAARKKDKRKKKVRIIMTLVGFLLVAGILVALYFMFSQGDEMIIGGGIVEKTHEPTVKIVDENSSTDEQITSRMKTFISQVEDELKKQGITPVKAVIPTNAVREVDFYLEGYKGYVKMLSDRGAGVSVEDTVRTLNYLKEQGKKDFKYIDIRVEGRAYWK